MSFLQARETDGRIHEEKMKQYLWIYYPNDKTLNENNSRRTNVVRRTPMTNDLRTSGIT